MHDYYLDPKIGQFAVSNTTGKITKRGLEGKKIVFEAYNMKLPIGIV